MATIENLIPSNKRSKAEARAISKKGGINSGKARREKKAIRQILSDLLSDEIKNNPQFAKIAAKLGVDGKKSVKELFTLICLFNSVKSGNLADLERLTSLLGEDAAATDNGILDELVAYLKPAPAKKTAKGKATSVKRKGKADVK